MPHTITKINSQDHRTKSKELKTINLLKENIGKYFGKLVVAKISFRQYPESTNHK